MNPHSWTYLNGSVRFCPSCKAYGYQRHERGCQDRWRYRRNASDAECIIRMGEAIATLNDSPSSPPRPSAKIGRCSKPLDSCIERGWARKTSRGWQCLLDPTTPERIPSDADRVIRTDSDGTAVACWRYRPDAWEGGVGRQKTPKRPVTQHVPDTESSASAVRAWLTACLASVSREGVWAGSLLAEGRGGERVASLLAERRDLGVAARAALRGDPYDDALDAHVWHRMMDIRPWR